MRQWRMGTLTLGVLLIALGCSFVLNKLGIISSVIQILNWWPLAIILLGIEVLIGGFLFTDDRCKLKFDGFSVLSILLTLFICAVSFVSSYLPSDRFTFSFPHNSSFYSDNSSFQKSLTIDSAGKEALSINNNFGNIKLQKSSGSNIEIEASIKAAYNDYEYAKTLSDNLIKVSEGKTLTITSDRSQIDNNKAKLESISYIIKIPEKINIDIFNKFGNVEASEFSGSLNINNSNGSLNINTLNGNLTIDNKFGDVTVKNIKGNLKLTDSNGRIAIEQIEGNVNVQNKFGDVELKNIYGQIEAKNENGAISLNNNKIIQKDVKLESRFGAITVKTLKEQEGKFSLYTRHGNIKADIPLNIKKDNTSESADAEIGSSKNQFIIKSESGNISINRIY